MVRFSPYCVIKAGISFLDLGAEIGMSSALVARTPGVRITAVEPNAQLRNVLREKLASIGPLCFEVPLPPWHSLHAPCSTDEIMECVVYAKFVVGIMNEVAPDVIRISGSHVVKLLPRLCGPFSTRFIVIEPLVGLFTAASFYRSLEFFQSNQWKVVQLSFGKRVVPAKRPSHHKFIFVAEPI